MNEILFKEKSRIEEKLKIFQDKNFLFEEESHTYTYSGKKFDSVTTFLKNFKEPFQRDYWVREKARQRGVDPSVIENEWQTAANKSTKLGTNIHKWIEDFWTGLSPEMPIDDEEVSRVNKFKEIYDQKFKNLIPLPSELKIFSKKWRLAGTIDQPFLMWDEKRNKILFLIGDWKTNKEFKHDDHPKGRYKKLLRPFHTLYENQHNEYSIQISLYRLILEEELGIETESGFLVHIGPDGPARIFPAKDLRAPLKAYLDQNRTSMGEIDIFDL
jgi:hypothetical protein